MRRVVVLLCLAAAALGGCGDSEPVGSTRLKLAAIGDSVTAGLGSANGSCRTYVDEEECEARRLSYAAVYARRNGIADDEWTNTAQSGSSPADWLRGPRLGAIVARRPKLTFVTLGANPLVGVKEGELVRRLKRIYHRLLSVEGNRVVVVAYYDSDPLRTVNERVERAVAEVQGEPGGNRLRLVRPPIPVPGDCGDPGVPTTRCLHPSAQGHQKIALAIASLVPLSP